MNALLELALAGERIVMAEPNHRFRAALDAAFALADPTGEHRRAAARADGCTSCGGQFGDDDPPEAELCRACAALLPCVVCEQTGECGCGELVEGSVVPRA